MDYVFKNNGKAYRVGSDNCGGGDFITIDYRSEILCQLRSIELIIKEEKGTGLFGKILNKNGNKNSGILKIGYQIYSSSDSVDFREIVVLPEEMENAKSVVAMLEPKIVAYKEYKQQFEADNAIMNMKEVSVKDVDGKIYQLPVSMKLDDDTKCLVCGGKSYHTCLSCFKNWTVEMRKHFNGWTVISLDEAEQRGLKKCGFCDESDNYTLDDFLDEFDDDLNDMMSDGTLWEVHTAL